MDSDLVSDGNDVGEMVTTVNNLKRSIGDNPMMLEDPIVLSNTELTTPEFKKLLSDRTDATKALALKKGKKAAE